MTQMRRSSPAMLLHLIRHYPLSFVGIRTFRFRTASMSLVDGIRFVWLSVVLRMPYDY